MIELITIISFLIFVTCGEVLEINFKKLKEHPDYLTNLFDSTPFASLCLGTPPQCFDLEMRLEEFSTFVIGEEYNEGNMTKFSSKSSSSYSSIDEEASSYSGHIFYNAFRSNDTLTIGKMKVDNFSFLLGTSMSYIETFGSSGVLGLDVQRSNLDSLEDYNLIKQLKKRDFISSYAFTVKYTSDREGKLIIGGTPDKYDPKHYSQENFSEQYAHNEHNIIKWALKFGRILYNDTEISQNINIAYFDVTKGVIIGNNEYRHEVHETFFKKYIESGDCAVEEYLGSYLWYHCKAERVNFKEMGELRFFLRDNTSSFVFDDKDLFVEDGKGNKYFLVIFKKVPGETYCWYLGTPFLKKYQTVFNQEKKMIRVYRQVEKKSGGISSLQVWLIIIGIFLIVVLLLICIRYNIQRPRLKRANELVDEYSYVES